MTVEEIDQWVIPWLPDNLPQLSSGYYVILLWLTLNDFVIKKWQPRQEWGTLNIQLKLTLKKW